MEKLERKELTFLDGNAIYLKAIVSMMAVQLLAMIIVGVVNSSFALSKSGENLLNLFVTIMLQGAYAFTFIFFVLKKKKKLSYDYTKRPSVLSMVAAVVLAAVIMIAFIGPAQVFSDFLGKIGFSLSSSFPLETPIEIILGGFSLIILAPIFEELIFRGALLSGLRQKFGVIPSCLLSGAAFALMHMNPEQTVYQFFLGTLIAYVVIMSGSIIPAFIMHAVSNLIAMLVQITPLGAVFSAFLGAILTPAWIAAIALPLIAVAGIAVIYFVGLLINKKSLREKFNNRLKETDKSAVNNSGAIDENKEMTDEEIIQRNGGLLGKKTGMICYITAIAICTLMWFIMLATGFMTVPV